MDRRLLITTLACWPASRLLAQDEGQRPRHRISAATLYEALSARFPVRTRFGGLLELQVSAPRLHLLPARNRLGATLLAQVNGLHLPRAEAGELDVSFALRYEAVDQTVRARQPEVLDLRWPGLPPEVLPVLQRVWPRVAQQVGEVVLHRFTPRELAVADTMGFEPEEITVVDDGLLVFFGPKQRR